MGQFFALKSHSANCLVKLILLQQFVLVRSRLHLLQKAGAHPTKMMQTVRTPKAEMVQAV